MSYNDKYTQKYNRFYTIMYNNKKNGKQLLNKTFMFKTTIKSLENNRYYNFYLNIFKRILHELSNDNEKYVLKTELVKHKRSWMLCSPEHTIVIRIYSCKYE